MRITNFSDEINIYLSSEKSPTYINKIKVLSELIKDSPDKQNLSFHLFHGSCTDCLPNLKRFFIIFIPIISHFIKKWISF